MLRGLQNQKTNFKGDLDAYNPEYHQSGADPFLSLTAVRNEENGSAIPLAFPILQERFIVNSKALPP